MIFGSRPSRWVLLVAICLGNGLVSTAAWGADAGPATAAAPAGSQAAPPDADKQARSLFAQGQIHYSLGEYEQAIVAFRHAYELSAAPGLLFNIAQAHRLNGQCREALEIYRHFIRLAPDSPYLTEAETHVAALADRCPASATAAAPPAASATARPPADAVVAKEAAKPAGGPPALLSPPRVELAQEAPPRWSTRRRAAAALLAGGVGAGLAAGVVYSWNGGRYDDWQKEDRRLAAGPAPGTSNDAWLAAQQGNDSLLRSVQRVDTVDLVLVGLSVAAVVASAVTLIALDR